MLVCRKNDDYLFIIFTGTCVEQFNPCLVTEVEQLMCSQVLHVVAASKEDDIRLSSLLHPLSTAITTQPVFN